VRKKLGAAAMEAKVGDLRARVSGEAGRGLKLWEGEG